MSVYEGQIDCCGGGEEEEEECGALREWTKRRQRFVICEQRELIAGDTDQLNLARCFTEDGIGA